MEQEYAEVATEPVRLEENGIDFYPKNSFGTVVCSSLKIVGALFLLL